MGDFRQNGSKKGVHNIQVIPKWYYGLEPHNIEFGNIYNKPEYEENHIFEDFCDRISSKIVGGRRYNIYHIYRLNVAFSYVM